MKTRLVHWLAVLAVIAIATWVAECHREAEMRRVGRQNLVQALRGQPAVPWERFALPGTAVSVEMPERPEESVTEVSQGGISGPFRTYHGHEQGMAFMTGWFQYSAGSTAQWSADELLASSRDNLIATSDKRLRSESQIHEGPYSGREIVLEYEREGLPSVTTLRFFVVGDRVFEFIADAPQACLDEARVKRFFESVQLPRK